MGERAVRFNGIEEIKEFVSAACRCAFDIDVINDRIVVDAKSILGMLSLDCNGTLKVRYENDDLDPGFESVLDKFSVKL